MGKFVFDATPLIHLGKSGLAPLLTALKGDKLTVPRVVKEVVRVAGLARPEHPDAGIVSSFIESGTIAVSAPLSKAFDSM